MCVDFGVQKRFGDQPQVSGRVRILIAHRGSEVRLQRHATQDRPIKPLEIRCR